MQTELPRHDAPLLTLEVDHRTVTVPEGTNVLRAAELAGVYVPSLCFHKELTPFGGCRLCAVEIEGMRGYPLACSTVVREGMRVITDTVALREMRREILQLILSEHPSSCLICGEQDSCRRSQQTIHKAGVATGCLSCPNDRECELQTVVERLGVTEIGYPVSYRGLEPEHDDPFYDRDYNLCILCGRCVRMCQEVRGTAVLAFKHRGPRTLIGPAFASSHIEAGCEFCGACVSVCPTGALEDKVSKWDGKPDGVEVSTCPFCALGCALEVAHGGGRLSWARGAQDPELNDGQLCVRGRFCLPETTHHHARARKPMVRRGAYFRVASWDEALTEATERLAGIAPDDLVMLVSPDLSNEALFAAQRFVRSAFASSGIDSTARSYLPGGPAHWTRLFSLPISLRGISEADAVVVAGLDSRFSFSVVGVQIRRALRRGGRLVAVDARESNLARMAAQWVEPPAGDEAVTLTRLLRALRGSEDGSRLGPALRAAAGGLTGAGRLAVVVGPRVFDCRGAQELTDELELLAARDGVTVMPLAFGANIRGLLELGALGELLPGPRPAQAGGPTLDRLRTGRPPRVLYLVGESPFTSRPPCDVVIAQDLYLPPFDVDVFLPAASFAEADSTLTNIEGRVQEVRAVERLPADAPHGFALPDWRIFSDLAGRLGRPDLEYASAAAVRAVIRAELPDWPADGDRAPRRMRPLAVTAAPSWRTAGKGPFVLVQEHAAFRHRGVDLAGIVEGLGELHLEEGLRMNPEDMAELGVDAGGVVTVGLGTSFVALAAQPDAECQRGAVYLSRPEAFGSLPGRAGLAPLLARPARPQRVTLTAGYPSSPWIKGGARGRAR